MESTKLTPYVNVLDPDFYVDPWAAYGWLRDEAPAFWDSARSFGRSRATTTSSPSKRTASGIRRTSVRGPTSTSAPTVQ